MPAYRSASGKRRQCRREGNCRWNDDNPPLLYRRLRSLRWRCPFRDGGGEVAGTAIEMGAKVRLKARLIPGGASRVSTMHFEGGSQLKELAPSSFYAVTGLPIKKEGELPVFATYLGGDKIAPLANLSEDLTLAARNATISMIDFLVESRGLTREQAYILVSVAVDLNISQVVDFPNVGVTAILNR